MPSKKYALLITSCIVTIELYHLLVLSKGRGLGLQRKLREREHHTDTKYSLRISSELLYRFPDCSARHMQPRLTTQAGFTANFPPSIV